MAEDELTPGTIDPSIPARGAGTAVIIGIVLALLVGILAGGATAIDRESNRGDTPCVVDGQLITNERYCENVPSYGTVAIDGLVVFVASTIATFVAVILLTVLGATGWRVLKWALSSED